MGWIVILLVIGLIVWRTMPAKGVRTVSPEVVKPLLKQKGNQFIDVRTPGEYSGRHVKEFKSIPLNDLPKRLGELDKDKPVYVICQSGMRSGRAASLLKKKGFSDVVNVKGGMSAWR
ncbi:rhodanese-like domain-containing protein [Sporosarcina trichiuri]|uniref:rhodanese-like domain-containing protein n=1 Tax=Sporosarcina trichiuri TaxID=3056445 RepID=UPI0025B3C7F2|nr:rhodanese-like domain-containing protein [Sporosarcina sp. 0.2-SM1T-5]WJY26854.1 rhodanese-like domain-containing protein [Sporosarcina sp. 0.2-SM1T-5]